MPLGIKGIKFYPCLWFPLHKLSFGVANLFKFMQKFRDKKSSGLYHFFHFGVMPFNLPKMQILVSAQFWIWILPTRSWAITRRPNLISDFATFSILELCVCLLKLELGESVSNGHILPFLLCSLQNILQNYSVWLNSAEIT